MVGSAFGLGNNMIDGEVLEREGDVAAITNTLLLTKDRVLVSLVRRQFAYVVTLGNIFAVYEIVK